MSHTPSNGYKKILIIGLQKTGQIVEYLDLVDRFIPENRLLAIDDDFRYEYIYSGQDKAGNGFGYETYYGQDFIYKTPSGRSFVFGLPFPFEKKTQLELDFDVEKTNLDNFPEMKRALKLITHFESDLYENAVIPIALAHRYTAISLRPGGQVLDLFTEQSLPDME